MVFSSMIFIFGFLPLILGIYYVTPRRYKNLVLLIGSFVFYSYGGVRFTFVVLGSIILNYCFGRLISYYRSNYKAKVFLFLGVVCNIAVLGYFKYWNFFWDNFSYLLGGSMVLEKIVMPIGISFFTFQGISYVVDVYRGQASQRSFVNISLYIMFFPQLIAGPIVRYADISKQISSRQENIIDFGEGVERFIIGLGKKVLISNVLGEVAKDVFVSDSPSVFLLWIGIICFTLQIYYDFSGYSDMAIGLSRMFGFKIVENFNYPYISMSITEFWRRWHISLGSFFRDYVYIPLGGNRCSAVRNGFNLFIVWGLTGFWHGAEFKFIIWGLYFGCIIKLERAFLLDILRGIPGVFRHIYTLLLIMIGWVIFEMDSLGSCITYLKGMFFLGGNTIINTGDMFYIVNYGIEIIIAIIFSMPIMMSLLKSLENSKVKIVSVFFNAVFTPIMLIGILYFVVMSLVNTSFNPFIYFRF
ncbi:MAG: MBOAT family O-acyltransferase [Clostridium sp.]